MSRRHCPELQDLIGEAALVSLAEAFGGTRKYIPQQMGPDHEIVAAIGPKAAAVLSARLAPDVISVPLAREARARQYRGEGESIREIARRLGITEQGVGRLLKRMENTPAKGSKPRGGSNDDDRQPDMFRRV